MKTRTIDSRFISFEAPVHWHDSREEREKDDQILILDKHIAYWCGHIEIRTRRYSKRVQLPRTADKLLKHLTNFAQEYVDRWVKQPPVEPRDVESNERDDVKIIAATFDTYDDVAEIHGMMRIWQISKRRDFVFVIYRSADWYESCELRPQELHECEAIVASVRYRR